MKETSELTATISINDTMQYYRSIVHLVIVLLIMAAVSIASADTPFAIIPALPAGHFYHGVHPMPLSSRDEDLRPEDLVSYEKAAGKTAAWVDISQHWGISRKFPAATAAWIRASGSIPSIRLMLWSRKKDPLPEPVFTLDAIIKGTFDDDFSAWGAAAAAFGTPLIVEFGPEMNGSWYPWNGSWSGGGETKGYGDPALPDGPEKFRDAYRHIINIMRTARARNILWVFHVNYNDWPNEAWNRFENYYPGDEYIDWLAVSIYGAQQPVQESLARIQRADGAGYTAAWKN